ncbi:serine/threonine protein kinase [Microbispora sp. SCL1-1]|uniref:serine/threonine-protein kinase n=1 Tax=unclassified Microbispora TaxID=2614687 RepID=UPI001157E488|nr:MULTISPECIES: serine/threonine-protein kinase [unclassified Microbispora]NJP23645.1 serine/threonine protein kinase [Microbispora sp. CL1-1]TQS15862.1 serine/threonine protein kinase [Microbispora sp. SCL1-1]
MAESLRGTLASRYHLVRPLGSGGMGTVWLARDSVLDREVAIKELRLPEGLGERERAELIARVMREAEVTARVRHPGIVALHDVLLQDGRPWIVMELLHGHDLARQITAYGPMPYRQVADLGARLLDALSATHAEGVQHRDVKPGNVFLSADGRVLLTDFGIARPADQASITEAGLMVGSPGFIAPERLAGEPGGPASDLWSLAATLYTAAEGVAPYQGRHSEVIRATLTQAPRPPVLSRPLGPVLLWMMAREPAARPDAATALGLLRQVADGGVPDLDSRRGLRIEARKRTPRWWYAAGAVALTGVAAAVAVVVLSAGPDERPSDPVHRVSPTFNGAVDLCRALPAGEVRRVLGAAAQPRPGKTSCQWTVKGSGIELSAETDSDTPEPWKLDTAAAQTLMEGLRRQYASGPRDASWLWYEIGLDSRTQVIETAARDTPDVADEAFAFDLTTPDGKAQAAGVYFRLGDLVLRLQFADLDVSSPADLRDRAVSAASAAAEGLRELA